MKVGYVSGINSRENDDFLKALYSAYNYMRDSGEASELEILIANPGLAELYSGLENDCAQSESLICEKLCGAIKRLSRNGAQEIIIPYGAQLYFPYDYIMENSIKESNHKVHYTLYKHAREMVKGIVRHEDSLRRVDDLLQSERLDLLGALGVMGLSKPAEIFSSSDYLEEHIEKTSYSLYTPDDRVETWGKLTDVFYRKEPENETLRELYYEVILKMDNSHRVLCGDGLQGLFVTDFWTESLLGVEYHANKLVGQVALSNGTTLPVMNLERIEAWVLIGNLLHK